VRLGALAWPVERTAGVAGLAAKLARLLGPAAARADMLLLPEYACMEIAQSTDEPTELRLMVEQADAVLAAMRDAARRHSVWLQPGTLPMRSGDIIINRAPLIRPDGAVAFQDKWQMTRFERERWGVSRGAPPAVFDTPWGMIGISVCYDAEFPKHVRAQIEAGAWLVLVPACTDTRAGAARVTISARARAIENQCIVAVAPTVGVAPWSAALDVNHGQAGIYGPADRGFPDDGVLAEAAPDMPGWVFATLDATAIERVREDGGVLNHRDWPRAPLPPVTRAVFA
jgi:predicted amidohydrolase